jgi:hypothetical protein
MFFYTGLKDKFFACVWINFVFTSSPTKIVLLGLEVFEAVLIIV